MSDQELQQEDQPKKVKRRYRRKKKRGRPVLKTVYEKTGVKYEVPLHRQHLSNVNEAGLHAKEKTWLQYEEARDIMRKRCIPHRNAYWRWHDIFRVTFVPKRPEIVYKDKGWNGWNDYLGNNNFFGYRGEQGVFLPFWEAARKVHALGLKTRAEYEVLAKEGRLPEGVPKHPESVYKDMFYKGVGWIEWLGKDIRSRVEADDNVDAHRVWGFVSRVDNPSNVVTVLKCTLDELLVGVRDNRYRVLKCYVYESEMESWLWDMLESCSSAYYGEVMDRVCSSLDILFSELSMQLLKVDV